jgi:hypothetical protein
LDIFFSVIVRRTSVERALEFVPRQKPLTAHALCVKKHQSVRQSLYVPLPVFSASVMAQIDPFGALNFHACDVLCGLLMTFAVFR